MEQKVYDAEDKHFFYSWFEYTLNRFFSGGGRGEGRLGKEI